MIFVTVGSQIPFDRLIAAVDDWANKRGRTDVFAQIGNTEHKPRHVRFCATMPPDEFRAKMNEASAIVGHAGMGTILSAMEIGKPVLIFPRRGHLKETRNDHQYATAKHFQGRPGISVALDEAQFYQKLDEIDSLAAGPCINRFASPRLINALRGFFGGGVTTGADSAPSQVAEQPGMGHAVGTDCP